MRIFKVWAGQALYAKAIRQSCNNSGCGQCVECLTQQLRNGGYKKDDVWVEKARA